MAVFNDQEDEYLVELVSRYPPIFNTRHKSHKDIVVREHIWDTIAEELNKTSDCCKLRWKCIRDSYTRIKRKNKMPTGSAAGPKSKWALLERLSFLGDVLTERKSIRIADFEETAAHRNSPLPSSSSHNEAEDVNDEMRDEDTRAEDEVTATERNEAATGETPAPGRITKKKIKLHNDASVNCALLKYLEKRDAARCADVNDVKSFCAYIESVLINLRPRLRLQAKSKIFSALSEYELINLNENDPNSFQNIDYSSSPTSPISSVRSPFTPVQALDLNLSSETTELSGSQFRFDS